DTLEPAQALAQALNLFGKRDAAEALVQLVAQREQRREAARAALREVGEQRAAAAQLLDVDQPAMHVGEARARRQQSAQLLVGQCLSFATDEDVDVQLEPVAAVAGPPRR